MIHSVKRTGLILALVFLCALPWMAQGSGGPPHNGGGQGGMGDGMRPPKPPIDMALDTSGDGVIDASEIANAPTALKKLDTAGSGRLTREQCLPRRPGGQGKQGGQGGPETTGAQGMQGGQGGRGGNRPLPPIFVALDSDGDGVISASEMTGASAALKKLDKNGDGKLSPDEYRPPRPDEQGATPGRGGEVQGRSRPGG